MPMLTLALVTGAGAFLYVAWGSWLGAYPLTLAITRGAMAFVAVSLLAFVSELAIATLRPERPAKAARAPYQPTPIRPLTSLPEENAARAGTADEAQRAA
jgi:hypothetical protein